MENEEYSTLVALIDQAGLTEALSGEGPFTLFAPNNGAFEELSPAILDRLGNEPDLLQTVLTSHVLEGAYGVNDLQDAEAGSLVTLEGEALEVDLGAGGLTVNGAGLDSTDVDVTYANGVLHGVSDIIVPASLQAEFGAEGEVTADAEDTTDATAETTEDTAAATEAAGENMTDSDLVTVLSGDERFSTLVTAIQEAGLVETLQGEGPFTVFAPTNDAFAALPEGELDALLADPEVLQRVLSYHVAEGEMMAQDMTDGTITTVEGTNLDVTTADGIRFNNAAATEPDIMASNGVIHVIDSVLLPEDLQ